MFFQKRSPQHQAMRRLARRLKKAGIPAEVNFVTGLPRPGGKTARVVRE